MKKGTLAIIINGCLVPLRGKRKEIGALTIIKINVLVCKLEVEEEKGMLVVKKQYGCCMVLKRKMVY